MHTRSSRRRFLAQSTLIPASLFAGGNLTSPVLAALNPVRRSGGPRIKVALNAYSFSKVLNSKSRDSGFGLLELVDYCAQQGFEGLDATGYFFPGYPNTPADSFVYELKRRAFDCGVGISGTGVRNNFTTADREVRAAGVQHVKEWVEVAAKLGAPVVRVFADTQMRSQTWQTVAPGATRDEVENWIADDLRQCAEHGERFGVIIGVQNHGDFLKTGDEHLSLVRRVDSPWCGPIVDTGYYKTEDPYQDITAVAPYAVNWQIKESPIAAGSPVRTDLNQLMAIVRTAGYRGYLPIETLSSSGSTYDPFDVVPRFLAEVRKAIDATASVTPPPASAPVRPSVTTVEPVADARPTRKPPNRNKTRSTSN
jgi:sugar phosphate isomerase/epimerase